MSGEPKLLALGPGPIEAAGSVQTLPAGSLALSDPRELLVNRHIRAGYGPDGRLDNETLRLWGPGEGERPDQVPETIPDGEVISVVDDEVIWGGALSAHFGHFLIESVARLWPLATGVCPPDTPVVFTTPTIRSFSADWLEAFGANVFELPEGIVHFRRVRIPQPAWRIDAWVAPEIRTIHLQARRGLNPPTLAPAPLRWLSRAKIELSRRIRDEALMEYLLAEAVDVVRPESMTLAEQVAAIESSEAIVGTVGSAFHSMLLAEEPPKALYLCSERVASTFVAQDSALGVSGSYVQALATELLEPARTGKRRRYRLLVPETLRTLAATVAPGLLSDRRLASFAQPELPAAELLDGPPPIDMETKIRHALLDPNSINARMHLGGAMEEAGHADQALEQFLLVADLTDDYAYAPLRAARLLAAAGNVKAAADMARSVLAIDPDSEEAARYAAAED